VRLRRQKQVFIHTWLSRAYLALARLSCHIGLHFISFSSLKPDTNNSVNFDTYQANLPALTRYNFLKHTPKLIIFGTHNLQTFKHNTLINELLLMKSAISTTFGPQ